MSQRYLSHRRAGTLNALPHKISLSHSLAIFLLKTLTAITHTPSCTSIKALGPARPPERSAGGRPWPGMAAARALPARPQHGRPSARAVQRARGGPPCPYPRWRPTPCLPCPAPNQDGGSGHHPGLLPALKMAPPHRLPPPTEWRRAAPTRPAPYPARGQSASRGAPGRQPREAGGPSPHQGDSSAGQWSAGAGEAGRAAPPFCESITRSGLARPAIAAPPLRSRRVVSVCNGRVSPARRRSGAAGSAAGPFLWCGSSRVEDPRRGWSDTCGGPAGAGGGGSHVGSPPALSRSSPRGRRGKRGGPSAPPRANRPRVRSAPPVPAGRARGSRPRRALGPPAWGAHGDPAGPGGGRRSRSAAGEGGGRGGGAGGAGAPGGVAGGDSRPRSLPLSGASAGGGGGGSRWIPFVTGFCSPKFRRREEGGQGFIAASPERRRYGCGPGPAPVCPAQLRKIKLPSARWDSGSFQSATFILSSVDSSLTTARRGLSAAEFALKRVFYQRISLENEFSVLLFSSLPWGFFFSDVVFCFF